MIELADSNLVFQGKKGFSGDNGQGSNIETKHGTHSLPMIKKVFHDSV